MSTQPVDPTPTLPTLPAPVVPLRHVSRHLQTTVYRHIAANLESLGWTKDPVMFNTTPFAVQLGRRSESDMAALKPNLVGISFGEEPEQEELELGGGLSLLQTAVVCDIVPLNEGLGLAIADDIKDLLNGRTPGSNRFLPLREYTSDPAGTVVDGYQIEFTNVQRRRNDSADFRLHWQQVIALVELSMPGWD